MLDPRHTPKAAPATRADCESYVARLFDAAETEGDPNNFPTIMRRLTTKFPLDEWEPTKEKS